MNRCIDRRRDVSVVESATPMAKVGGDLMIFFCLNGQIIGIFFSLLHNYACMNACLLTMVRDVGERRRGASKGA